MKFFTFISLALFVVLLINIFFFTANKQRSNLTQPAFQQKEVGQLQSIEVATLEQVFDNDYNPADFLPQDKIITLLATGDVMVGRAVNVKAKSLNDYNYPYKEVLPYLQGADITLINLEGPVVEDCPQIDHGFTFCGNVQHITEIANAGIDVVNLENNHILNYGKTGLETTVRLLKQHNLTLSDSTEAHYLETKATRFAFLGYNDLNYPTNTDLEKENIQKDIAQAKGSASFIIVSMHWGNEYQSQPTKRQITLGHFLIDAGADLVIGNHPHWVQPIEVYKERVIVYSHGNFIFDQTWSEKTKEGIIGRYTFFENKIIDADFLPVYIEQVGQPKLATGDRGKKIQEEMKNESIFLQARKNSPPPNGIDKTL